MILTCLVFDRNPTLRPLSGKTDRYYLSEDSDDACFYMSAMGRFFGKNV